MIDLTVRRIPFNFDGVDFVWNKANPGFAINMNKVSFYAVGFEKYICQAMSDAEELITDPRVLQELKDFRAQESIHSMAHRKHCKALIAQTPALQAALDRSIELYDELYAAEDLKYHLAYVGGLESIFTPFARSAPATAAASSGGFERASINPSSTWAWRRKLRVSALTRARIWLALSEAPSRPNSSSQLTIRRHRASTEARDCGGTNDCGQPNTNAR